MGLALTAVWYPSGPVKRRRADHVGSALSKLNTFTVADGGEVAAYFTSKRVPRTPKPAPTTAPTTALIKFTESASRFRCQ